MTLPSPNLDDRSFDDILREAKQKISALCPQWTDHNPSDPGMTLIELMAWMTETILYRLNRVPEKNYIKFLELIGVRLRPAQPARSWVEFKVSPKAPEDALPMILSGTRLSTRSGNGEPLVFETVDPLNLTAARIIKLCSRYGEQVADHTGDLAGEGQTVARIFCGELAAPHVLYLGDRRVAEIFSSVQLKILVSMADELEDIVQIEWERWDGERWEIVIPSEDETRGFRTNGAILFEFPAAFITSEVNDIPSCWLRARLAGIKSDKLPRIVSLKLALESKPKYALWPEKGFLSTENAPYHPIEFVRAFHPFGRPADQAGEQESDDRLAVKEGNVFYLKSSVFGKKGARISIHFTLAEDYTPPGVKELENVKVDWEYYAETGEWKLLGKTGVQGVIRSEHDFNDETDALTEKQGAVRFFCPQDIAEFTILGEAGFYLRARLSRGLYGLAQPAPPLVSEVSISFTEQPQDWSYCLSENYHNFEDLAGQLKEGGPIQPFVIDREKDPAFYLALDPLPANKSHRMYLKVREQPEEALVKLSWEYWAQDGWKTLRLIQDGTACLSKKGGVEYVAPADWHRAPLMFGCDGYWLRVRWEAGEYFSPPGLGGVYLNAVQVVQNRSISDEILGSSNNEPNQRFRFSNVPILAGAKILVKEAERPSVEEIDRLKKQFGDAVNGETMATTELWLRWQEVENFFNSGPDDRHYVADLPTGTIFFGDGKRGKVPPAGRENIKAKIYCVCDGARGNAGKGCINVLEKSYPFVESVSNVESAQGGADGETIEEAKLRGPWVLKHRHRAVTREDFEHLAVEASPQVAKAKCFSENGQVHVVVLPKSEHLTERPLPSSALIEKIHAHLEERRLITSRVKVTGPQYEGMWVEVIIVLTPRYVGRFPEIKIKVETELKAFVHPLYGGPEGHGWPMGRTVHISELYYLLESIEGVDYVEGIKMKKAGLEQPVEKIRIAPRAFPYFQNICVEQA